MIQPILPTLEALDKRPVYLSATGLLYGAHRHHKRGKGHTMARKKQELALYRIQCLARALRERGIDPYPVLKTVNKDRYREFVRLHAYESLDLPFDGAGDDAPAMRLHFTADGQRIACAVYTPLGVEYSILIEE